MPDHAIPSAAAGQAIEPGPGPDPFRVTAAYWCKFSSALVCLRQFWYDHPAPLLLGSLLLLPAWWLQPQRRQRQRVFLIPALFLGILLMDAFVLRHWITVFARRMSAFGMDPIVDVIPSPSGKTIVYVVDEGFHTHSLHVYLSSGGLFPHSSHLYTDKVDPGWEDIKLVWDRHLFTAKEEFPLLVFDERSRRLTTHSDWQSGRAAPNEPERTKEAFARHIDTLQ